MHPVHLWLLLGSVLLLQEPLSTTFVVLEMVRAHYSIILVHLMWIILTVLQIYLGHVLGKWVQRRLIPLSQGDQYVVSWLPASVDRDGGDGSRQWRERAV